MEDVQFSATEQRVEFSVLENPIAVVVAADPVSFTVSEQAISFPNVTESISFTVGGDAVAFTVQGIVLRGPPGADGVSEDEMTYAKRVDWISESVLYKGEAAVGSATSAAVWRIRRVTLESDDDVTEVWAGGSAAFDKIWDDRASFSYS